MVPNTFQSRRKPWPYDAYIKGIPVLLQPGEDGNLVSRKSKTLEATAPVTFEYSSASPYKERTVEFTELFGGMGLGVEPIRGDIRRYAYTVKTDASINGLTMKGPKFETHLETIVGAGAIKQTIRALHGGVETTFAVCDNGVWRRIADNNWTPSLTSGTTPAIPGGQHPLNAMRFKARYTGGVDGLYVGTDVGNIWRYDGATWTQAAAGEGPGTGVLQGECRYLEQIQDEFWVAGDYWVVKTTADPMLRASYAGVIYIGDQSAKISWIAQNGNTLYIFKVDGRVYTITADGQDQELFSQFQAVRSNRNGRNASVWLGKMWAPLGDSLIRLDNSANLEFDGLDRLLDNDSPVRGVFVAGAGHSSWFMYEIYYNASTDTSFLVKHGSWVSTPDTGNLDKYVDVHHGAIYDWDREATSCQVLAGTHPSGNDRLYVGFVDGTIEWCVLPKDGADPSKDANCEFTGEDSYLYFCEHHAKFQADNKLWIGASVFGPYLSNTEYVQLEYRLSKDEFASWELLQNGSVDKFTISSRRIQFEDNPPVFSKSIQIRLKLLKDPDLDTSPANLTPIVRGIGVHESVRPSLELEYVMNILCSSYMTKYDGTLDRRRGQVVRNQLLDVAAQIGNLELILPDGTVQIVACQDYADSFKAKQNRREIEPSLQMSFIQVQTLTAETLVEALTYDQLEQYTLDELEDVI